MWHILFSIKIEKFYQNFPVFMGYTSNRSKCVCKQSIMWIIGYGWWWLFRRQKQVHIVCSNCSEEPISPLHRGINISSTSIGSQEVRIAAKLIILGGWSITHQSTVPVSLYKRYFRRLSRVQLGGVGVQGGELGDTSCSNFYIHDFGWKARGAATGEICRAGTALLSTRWRQKSWQDIFKGLQWRLSTLHPSIRNTRAKSQVAQGRTSLEAPKCLIENEQINKDAYKFRLI